MDDKSAFSGRTALVVGASGATGRLLAGQLLDHGWRVKAMVRSAERLPEALRNAAGLEMVLGSILDFDEGELRAHVAGCDAIGSCLGHNLSFRGVFGHPRMLVLGALRRLCNAVAVGQSARPVRLVLMSSAGVRNHDLPEPLSLAHRSVIGLLRLLVPPHLDNERSADYLRSGTFGKTTALDWVAVRPDSLINTHAVSGYTICRSPIRSAIFDPGKTSRINVAHFMARLMIDDAVWAQWKGQMPVIYNQESMQAHRFGP